MRLFYFALCLLVILVRQVGAQGLDIGGIELHLGQDVAAALNALSSYQVRYNEEGKFWIVTQRGESPFELLGSLSAIDGKLSTISKSYRLTTQYDTQRVYTQASRDVHRRGGNVCETREVEYTDDQIRNIETRCGRYRLSYSFPSTYQGDNVGPGINIRLSTK
jgi:hypothetical protein